MLLELPVSKRRQNFIFCRSRWHYKNIDICWAFWYYPRINGGVNQQKLNEFNNMMKQFSNKEIDLFKAQFDASQMHLLSWSRQFEKSIEQIAK